LAAGETLRRVLTAAILIPAVAAVVLYAPTWVVAVVAALVTILALREFFALAAAIGLRGYFVWTVFCSVLMFIGQSRSLRTRETVVGMGETSIRTYATGFWTTLESLFAWPVEMALLMFLLGASLLALIDRRPIRESIGALALSGAAMVLIVVPFSYVGRVHSFFPWGERWLLFTLALVWAGDISAYFTGRVMGRHRMAPELSPKKTWEGAIGNILGSVVVALVFAWWIRSSFEIDMIWWLVVVAVLANIAGQIGDLVESAYKRAAGVKDSGGLLPGHGGMLDRIDSLIFAVPVVWAYLWLAGVG
jgi:phosphatidate cytidylyltransferase